MKPLTLLLSLLLALYSAQAQTTFKAAYHGHFLVGAAVNEAQFTEANAAEAAIVKAQFDTITPENQLKWEHVHPALDHYDFDLADRYVAFGEKNGMFIIGHNLVWHSQTPDWVFQDAQGHPLNRAALLERMSNHIATVVGRYRGRIKGWDVVNEALDEDGTLRASPWRKIIGDDFIEKAFAFAHAADPAAELCYNEYSLENPAKRQGAVKLIRNLQVHGISVAAIGLQGHYNLDWPPADQLNDTINTFVKLGLKVNITELDINILPSADDSHSADVSRKAQAEARLNPWPNGLPEEQQHRLAARYGELFSIFLRHQPHIGRVTFWGVTDADSWLNDWPIPGRTNYPLPFDRQNQSKPAVTSILAAVQKVP